MQPAIYILGAAILGGAFLLWRMSGPTVSRIVDLAIEDRDPSPILKAAESIPPQKRSQFFQQAITMLWENFERPLAIAVARTFAEQHSGEKICQFWLKQAMEVEPTEARKHFDEGFLKTHYNPDLAACCGKTSS
jgi:hypothetical protein